ncbi:cell wall-binding repeat-containing protein [Agrococcus sp. ARC_14]|uniref:cell wall-binding repeat-containing protein n=1 Tax=Agrococcus sp. ARC_14 TaxID=2919927 RepID=UPI001F062012|nr:cell wall-binding repeat-containing protein [Agrococcus sp. ARC_14]MCH1881455.1 cell wall-binding repeat-containing protein [Agrococcus sp. ARC_14]
MTTASRSARPRSTRIARALLAGVAALATAVTGVVLAPPEAAQAAVTAAPSWIGGKDHYATSALMSQQLPRSSTVYLTSGESGGDALAVPPAAVAAGAHVLMVRRDSVPGVVEARLRQLNPRYVNVVGARTVLSDALWRDVRSILPRASIYRVGPNAGDRVDSALALAAHIKRDNGRLDTVFVIGRNGYSDGLASGNVAARIGGAIVPAMGDANAWARRVAPLLNSTREVVFVGATSVLSQSYWTALDRVLGLNVAMDRIAGPDRYATNARVIEAFVGGISAEHVYLVAGNGHGDTVGASVLAARQDSIMMLSGRYCHDHEAIPSQVDWFEASRVIGIGTKFWITADALRLRMCGGGYWEDWQFEYAPGTVIAERIAPNSNFASIQQDAGRRFGTFPNVRASGPGSGTSNAMVGLPMGVYRAVVTGGQSNAGGGWFRVTAFNGDGERIGQVTQGIGDYRGTGFVTANEPIVYLEVRASGPWSLEVRDARHLPLLRAGSGAGDHVALWDGRTYAMLAFRDRPGMVLSVQHQWLWTTSPARRTEVAHGYASANIPPGPQLVVIQPGTERPTWNFDLILTP